MGKYSPPRGTNTSPPISKMLGRETKGLEKNACIKSNHHYLRADFLSSAPTMSSLSQHHLRQPQTTSCMSIQFKLCTDRLGNG
eukprot:6098223-Ditylum_brightwellii.AAC.1